MNIADAGRPANSTATATRRLAVNPMMWLLIASELAVFALALASFAGARALDRAGFLAAQNELNRMAGTINTAVLLTSGLFAALAVEAREAGLRARARAMLGLAGLLGVVFLSVKAHEYATEIARCHGLGDGGFFTLYFLITGFHAAHVMFGLVILAVVAVYDRPEHVETGAAFWHMVDLIWVLVFPCVYLLR